MSSPLPRKAKLVFDHHSKPKMEYVMHEIVALGGFATTTVRSASHWRAPRARAGALCGRRRSSEGLGHAHDGARVLVDEVAVASRRRRHLGIDDGVRRDALPDDASLNRRRSCPFRRDVAIAHASTRAGAA